MYSYFTKGTCSRQILFDVDKDNILRSVKFIGGCSGNLQGISKLAVGRNIDEIISLLEGVQCRNNTSCPDQLAQALKEYKNQIAK